MTAHSEEFCTRSKTSVMSCATVGHFALKTTASLCCGYYKMSEPSKARWAMHNLWLTGCTHSYVAMNVFIDNEYHRNVLKYRMDLNFRGTKLSQFSRFDSHPRKFSPAKI